MFDLRSALKTTALVTAVALWLAPAALAQSDQTAQPQAPNPDALSVPPGSPENDKTVAVVNGHEIKVSEVQMATDDIIGQLPDLPPKLRYPLVDEYLIERHL